MIFRRAFSSRCTQRTTSFDRSLLLRYYGRHLLRHRFKQLELSTPLINLRLLSIHSKTSLTSSSSELLPSYCPGCGAQSQAEDKNKAGHYSLTRPAVKSYLGHGRNGSSKKSEENTIFSSALQDHRKDEVQQTPTGAQISQSKQIHRVDFRFNPLKLT